MFRSTTLYYMQSHSGIVLETWTVFEAIAYIPNNPNTSLIFGHHPTIPNHMFPLFKPSFFSASLAYDQAQISRALSQHHPQSSPPCRSISKCALNAELCKTSLTVLPCLTSDPQHTTCTSMYQSISNTLESSKIGHASLPWWRWLKKCPNMTYMTWSDLVEFDYTDDTILFIDFLVLLKQVTTSETASGRLSTAGTAAGQQFYRPWNGNFAPKNGTWHCRNAAEKGWHLAGWVHKKGGEQKKRTTHTLNHRLHRLLHRIQEGTGNDLYNLYTIVHFSIYYYII